MQIYVKLIIFPHGVKAAICKIKNFSIVTGICPKYYCTQLSCAEIFVEKFSFSELKIEKIKFFTQIQPKFFALAFLTFGVA